MENKPNYVATCSAWSAVTFWRIIGSILIIPLIIMIVDIVKQKNKIIEFYDDYIIQKSGIFSKSEKQSAFTGVVGVSVQQSWGERMLNYGDVQVDVFGKWDIDTKGISNPNGLKRYLEGHFVKKGQMNNIMTN